MTYYRGMGNGGRCPGLHGLGMDESTRIRRNGIAENLALKDDRDALNYLRARGNLISSYEVDKGAPYEPEGGVVQGWATLSARSDARTRAQNVDAFLAALYQRDPPPLPPPPSQPSGPAQPLPEVTVLGKQDPPVALWLAAAVVGLLVLNR